MHALDLEALCAPGGTFWTLWRGGELKSMRTAAAFLRQGVVAPLLEDVLAVARDRG